MNDGDEIVIRTSGGGGGGNGRGRKKKRQIIVDIGEEDSSGTDESDLEEYDEAEDSEGSLVDFIESDASSGSDSDVVYEESSDSEEYYESESYDSEEEYENERQMHRRLRDEDERELDEVLDELSDYEDLLSSDDEYEQPRDVSSRRGRRSVFSDDGSA